MWVVDNSSAMTKLDGHRILGNFENISTVPVSRWEEVQDCVGYQAHMAGLFGLPTRFIVRWKNIPRLYTLLLENFLLVSLSYHCDLPCYGAAQNIYLVDVE
jgi:hypothetical protein